MPWTLAVPELPPLAARLEQVFLTGMAEVLKHEVRRVKNLVIAGAIGTAIGAVLAVVVQLIARAAGVDFIVENSSGDLEHVSLGQTVFASFVGGVILTAVALLVRRVGRQPLTPFLVIATLGVVVSFAGPLAATGTAQTAFSLMLMHIAAAAGIVSALARRISVGLSEA